jgi:hypothetical protein
MNFGRQSRSRGSELVLAVVALALPFKATGCGRTACFTVTSTQLVGGACPDVMVAEGRLQGSPCTSQGQITSVDGPGTLDNGLCCYPVTFGDSNSIDLPCVGAGGANTTVAVSTGIVGVGASGTTSTGPSCVTCNAFLAGMSGPLCNNNAPMPTALTAEVALRTCACTAGSCETECAPTLCGVGNAPDDACRACVLQACATEVAACNKL